MAMSVDECRTLLGALADGKSDAQVEMWRDDLTGIANTMYDHLQSELRAEREISETEALAGTVVSFPGFRHEFPDADGIRRNALEKVRLTAYYHHNTHEAQREGEE